MTQQISVLSSDLPTITAEINAYKRVAGEAVFEIGRRLKHVKENDLAHGQWSRWVERDIGLPARHANKFIKIVDELGEKWSTSTTLAFEVLYQIATLPSEDRERPHTIPSTGATKTVDEMTVRELREVKAALKEERERCEREREAREQAESHAQKAEADYETVRDFTARFPWNLRRIRRFGCGGVLSEG
ncbi:hypothetical protein J1TS5_61710 [Paenibacillus macerans]|uniref:DUF3102 domain-containing protein n=1 Tax=Paenibacillus macerans TaxID=44252 RepID=UPI001B121338|nr:DUF3102 domain-containing protein [Paenibacillus macerans]GIP14001.1 hypothetical protein J1TS5_61710 [Paenibacillus macerans]